MSQDLTLGGTIPSSERPMNTHVYTPYSVIERLHSFRPTLFKRHRSGSTGHKVVQAESADTYKTHFFNNFRRSYNFYFEQEQSYCTLPSDLLLLAVCITSIDGLLAVIPYYFILYKRWDLELIR